MSGFTTSASVALDQAAYDRLAYFALRPQMLFDQIADVQPTNQSMPGSSVIFYKVADLAVASTAINESTDVTPVALSDSTATVTMAEYGNVVKTTKFIRETAYIPLDPIVANVIGFNAGVSLDSVARGILQAGTNVRYAGGAAGRTTVIPTQTLTAALVRRMRVDLASANVADFGGHYVSFIHPDVAYDLRSETGMAAWRDPHSYHAGTEIWNGEIGMFEGFRFIESPRAPVFADAGSSTTLTDVYRTLFLGRQALAKAYLAGRPFPVVVPGPVTDNLRRFIPLGWYWAGGYAIFRQEAVRAVESASSIGTNA
jgi:N4-gp56 family major capsid protein